MTFPRPPLPGPPRPGPLSGAPRPGPVPGAARPASLPGPTASDPYGEEGLPAPDAVQPTDPDVGSGESTGHPAVDAVVRALANAVPLAPADQIAEYEAAHRVLQETLASIDRS